MGALRGAGRAGLLAAALALPALAPPGAAAMSRARQSAHSVPGIPGLPTGVPPAASAPEPALPEPSSAEWPFPSDFSHTSGTGLLSGGASLWTDFLYDDHGPLGSPVGIAANAKVSSLAPVHGGFVYPAGPADNDGADIFRAAVGYTPEATYWRVDWNTLADADVPIAEWTFATGSQTPASAERWPANAQVRSAGIQYALVVSARHAELLEAATGKPLAGADLHTEVNMQAHSFVVRIPTSVLAVSGSWQVRLAAGLANAEGTEFATVSPLDGGLPGGANVYNVTFRSYQQEAALVCPTEALPASGALTAALEGELGTEGEEDHVPVAECGNDWMESDQANTLATGNVAKYSLSVDWARLAARQQTPEPEPTGYSNRWYATPLNLGEGVVEAEGANTYTGPTYLGRVQPYAVYVPTGYDASKPKPTSLTWILHSLGANLNQYGGDAPTQIEQECQDRDSICATTEGFSDGQWYYGAAQVDFWDVWHQLASDYDLNPDTTVISGYSMGGFASYKLALEYPDLFAEAMPLEGPVVCGERFVEGVETAAGSGGQCESDGDTTPLVVNAKWIPYVMTYGALDELVPFTGGLEQVEAFNELGYRYYAVLYPAEDHLVFAVQNDFTPATSQLEHLEREQDPGSFTFSWYPDVVSSALGVGPGGDYWIAGLQARDSAPGALASVSASSAALREPQHTVEHHTGVADGPTPAVTDSLTWSAGARPRARQTLALGLTNVAAVAVRTAEAKLKCATITVSSDGATALTLLQLRAGSEVTLGGAPAASASSEGTATVAVPAGESALSACSAR
ncbi:MAG TPA: prolyl oligopeptidase family serine peptidase [Solirubrobacteraceae bacterium]|nr:prolyl oligopeptidase family serine peptidase [Solirubrobacteraceae bacterium]